MSQNLPSRIAALAVVVLVTIGTLCASPSKTIYLKDYPRSGAENAKKTLAELFTTAEAKAAFPDAFRAQATLYGWTDAQTMKLAMFNAMWTDALWKGAPYQSGKLLSRNEIYVHHGAWWFNDYLHYAYGTYHFANSGTGNAAYNSENGGCELMHWHENWQGAATNRTGRKVLFGAVHAGSNDLSAYTEGIAWEGGFRLDGRCGDWAVAGRDVVGFEAWDFGSGAGMEHLFAHHCDVNVSMVRGTPFNSSGTVSLFSGTKSGLEVVGGGPMNIATLELDDNPRGIASVAGYGRPATITGKIGLLKAEWAVTPPTAGRMPKVQTIELAGVIDLTIDCLSWACTKYQDAIFDVTPDNGVAMLTVHNLRVHGYTGIQSILHDRVNGKTWPYVAGVKGFRYSNVNGGELISWPVQVQPIVAKHTNKLGYLEADPQTGKPIGAFDRTLGLPSWSDVTGTSNAPAAPIPPPVDPTPVPPIPPPSTTPKWSTQFDGTDKTKLKTGSTVNASSSASWSGLGSVKSGVGTTQANSIFVASVPGATRVVLRGCSFTSASDWSYLCSAVRVMADGRILWSATGAVLGTMPKVKADVVIQFPASVDLSTVIGMPGNSAPVFSVEAMEVW